MQQAIALGKRPHILVGTPGRVVDHLSNTKVMPNILQNSFAIVGTSRLCSTRMLRSCVGIKSAEACTEVSISMQGFSLVKLRHLVLDEADRLLNMDFEQEIDQILKIVPKERRTQLFSATMTSKVAKLQRACLTDPVKVEVDSKYQTVDTLRQQYLFIPAKYKVIRNSPAQQSSLTIEHLASKVVAFEAIRLSITCAA